MKYKNCNIFTIKMGDPLVQVNCVIVMPSGFDNTTTMRVD